jgi:hypothetical protein
VSEAPLHTPRATRGRRRLDLAIVLIVLGAVLWYVPKLTSVVDQMTAAEGEADWDPRYPQALFMLGIIPLLGSALMLVPCLSWFSAPLPKSQRVFLAILCVLPLACAVSGALGSPTGLRWTFIGLGGLSSIGVWLLALPLVVWNTGLLELIGHRKSNAP